MMSSVAANFIFFVISTLSLLLAGMAAVRLVECISCVFRLGLRNVSEYSVICSCVTMSASI